MSELEQANEVLQAAYARQDEARRELSSADASVAKARNEVEITKRKAAEAIPVDRSQQQLVGGEPVPEDRSHTETKENGQQKDYVVLTPAERAKGFVRPVRDAYRHVGKRVCGYPNPISEPNSLPRICTLTPGHECDHNFAYQAKDIGEIERAGNKHMLGGCGHITTMGRSIAETYARDPHFYSGTFCTTCRNHFPVGERGEFTWYENDGREGPRVGT